MKIDFEQLPTADKLKLSLQGKGEWVKDVKIPHYRHTYRKLPYTKPNTMVYRALQALPRLPNDEPYLVVLGANMTLNSTANLHIFKLLVPFNEITADDCLGQRFWFDRQSPYKTHKIAMSYVKFGALSEIEQAVLLNNEIGEFKDFITLRTSTLVDKDGYGIYDLVVRFKK